MRIGIDLGGTKIELIALGERGEELYRKRVPTPQESYEDVVRAISALVHGAEKELGQKGTVGLGLPGVVSPQTGKVISANFNLLIGHDLVQDLEQSLGRQIRFSNDANCLAVSEAMDGAAAGHDIVFAVIAGTGCGAGIAIKGEAREGRNLLAGEFGHNQLPWMEDDELPGVPCWCGKRGCIECYISGTGFAQDYADHETGGVVTKQADEIIEMMRANDKGAPGAIAAFDRYVSRMARSLAHIVNILDPDAIVLAGGMSNVDELYERVAPLLARYVIGGQCDTPVLKNKHGDSSGIRGAAWLWSKDDKPQISSVLEKQSRRQP